jgi:hypothetical protein
MAADCRRLQRQDDWLVVECIAQAQPEDITSLTLIK